MGIYDAMGGPIPSNIEQLFPVWNDISTWNLAALSPIVRSYTLGVGQMQQNAPLSGFSGWIQDDWKIGSRVTVNLGARYDMEYGVYAEHVDLQPWVSGGRKNDKNNWSPRLGATYAINERTVLRGGYGKYFADPGSHTAYWTLLNANALQPQVFNDGRADFAANPFNGPIPTFAQVATTLCTVSTAPNCLRRSIGTSFAVEGDEIPYAYQASAGIQRQFGQTMSLEADYVYNGNRAMLVTMNANLAYDPATGINYPFGDQSKRPYPAWGDVSVRRTIGESDNHALQVAFTKRLSDRWQASATYLLAGTVEPPECADRRRVLHEPDHAAGEWRADLRRPGRPAPDASQRVVPGGRSAQPRHLQRHLGYRLRPAVERPLSLRRQRLRHAHLRRRRAEERQQRRTRARRRQHHSEEQLRCAVDASGRCALAAAVQARRPPHHRRHRRSVQRVQPCELSGFNLNESSAAYGKPTDTVNVSYQPRMLQLGVRASF